MIIVNLTTKVLLSVGVVSAPTTVGVYYCLPQSVLEKTFIPKLFKVFEKKYIYFLVSKTHPIKGAFYNQTFVEKTPPTLGTGVTISQPSVSTSSTDSEQIQQYKKNFQSWKDEADKRNGSSKDLFETGANKNKKNYKCSIPIFDPDTKEIRFRSTDKDCEIFSINATIKKASEIIDTKDDQKNLTQITEKKKIDYNKMYVLRVNRGNIDKFIFTKDLTVEVMEHDSPSIKTNARILSLDINNQYMSEKKTWDGKVNKILVTASGKSSAKNLEAKNTKECQGAHSLPMPCLAFNFEDGDSNHDQYEKITEVTKDKLTDDNKYILYFLSTKFNAPQSHRLTKDYKYNQVPKTTPKKTPEELVTFKYEKPVLGFIDISDHTKNQLFLWDKKAPEKPKDVVVSAPPIP